MNTQQKIAGITQIIHGKPAMAIATLPRVWQELATSRGNTHLSDSARADYVMAARLFRFHNTSLCMESLDAIGHDFDMERYPNCDRLLRHAPSDLHARTIAAVGDLFKTFGYDVPAAFYNALLGAVNDVSGIRLFHKETELIRDRLWDAVLHAMLLVTPIGLYVHSVFSQHGLRFVHMMNCSCKVEPLERDLPFRVSWDTDLGPAYLQNMVAAAFEQYGVNAATSRENRGF